MPSLRLVGRLPETAIRRLVDQRVSGVVDQQRGGSGDCSLELLLVRFVRHVIKPDVRIASRSE